MIQAMPVVGIGGLPATGKSALVKSLVNRLGGWVEFKPFQLGVVRGYYATEFGLLLIGLYGQETFPGTDRLSMAVQAPAIDLIREAASNPALRICRVLFEGDRLFTPSFVTAIREDSRISLRMLVLTASQEVLEQRRRQRLSVQSASWIAGRATKLRRLTESFPDNFQTVTNETPEDAQRNIGTAMRLLNV